MADREKLIDQFSNITGVTSDRAKFYLESAAWQIEVALASFYENDGNDEDLELLEDSLAERRRVPPPDGSPDLGPPRSSSKKPAKPKKENPPKRTSSSSSRINTLAGLSKERDSSSDEDEGQAFYAGGSEHSGQQVLGPGKKKRDFVSEMFKSVQEHGAEVVESSASSSSRSTFSGTGYKLGMSPADETVAIPDNSRRDTPRHTEVVLKLWKSGFSINDGALREYSDTNNKEFLDSIRKGEVPQELVHDARGSEVHLNMEDHRHEQFSLPKCKHKAFSGKGNMLGSPSPNTTASATATATSSAIASSTATASVSGLVASTINASGSNTENEARARELVPLDQALPSTTVQIRLADGTRLQAQFNHQQTVSDLRNYLEQARPEYNGQRYILLTTFPSRELTDASQTFVQAGLLNSAILQRLK